jgi:hemerythrin
MKKHEQTAKKFIEAVKEIAQKEANLENLESYLGQHFAEWLKKWASTPEAITAELQEFAKMQI